MRMQFRTTPSQICTALPCFATRPRNAALPAATRAVRAGFEARTRLPCALVSGRDGAASHVELGRYANANVLR
eukprot:6207585-Pleurochrysis_carterae.AAC.2